MLELWNNYLYLYVNLFYLLFFSFPPISFVHRMISHLLCVMWYIYSITLFSLSILPPPTPKKICDWFRSCWCFKFMKFSFVNNGKKWMYYIKWYPTLGEKIMQFHKIHYKCLHIIEIWHTVYMYIHHL